jgi:hypothetical protein
MWLRSIGYRLGQVRQQLGFAAPLSEADHQEVAGILPSSAAQALFCTMSPADQQHSLRVCRGLQARGCTDKDMLAAALLHDIGKAQSRIPFWTRPAIVIGKKLAPNLLSRLVLSPENIFPPRWDPITPMNKLTESSVGADLSRPPPIYRPPGKSTPSPHHRVPRGAERDPSMVGAIPCGRPAAVTDHHPPAIPKWRQSLSNAWYHADIGAELASAAGLSDRAVLFIRFHHQPDGPAAALYEVDEVS